MNNSNQCDHGEESINKQAEHKIGILCVFVLRQSIIKAIMSICQYVKLIYILLCCFFGQLYVKNSIGIFACNFLERFL